MKPNYKLSLLVLATVLLSGSLLSQPEPVTSTPVLKETTSWNGAAFSYPEGSPEISVNVVEIAPGAETGWHLHAIPSIGLMLEGELEVELRDGQRIRLKAGEALVETVNTLHNGTNVGTVPVKIAVIYAGVKELPLTQTESQLNE